MKLKKRLMPVAIVTAIAAVAVGAAGIGTGIFTPAQAESTEEPATVQAPAQTEQQWVDSVFNTLTPRQRVAQLFVPRLDATNDAVWHRRLKRLVDTDGVGGLLFGRGTISDYAALINYSRSCARVPLMITLDGEWGPSMNVKDAERFPHTMGVGATGDAKLLYDYGRETARECKALGINVDFAPVLDVNSNPANPIIGYRSLGEDPAEVARLGVAYSKGMEDGGVMSCAKHFPGHGDTSTDSHKTLPTVNHSRETLESVDLLPFKTYIDSGLSAIMVGHLKVPALDPSGTPASLSHKITTDYLKGTLGFKGLVFTDALAMKGAKSSVNNCVAAFLAGADVMLGSLHPEKDIEAVWQAVRSGKISQSEVDARVKKFLAFKYRFDITSNAPVKTDGLKAVVNSPEAEAVNRRLCATMITALRNDDNLLPLGNLDKRKIAVVSIGAGADNKFSQYCGKYAPVTTFGAENGALSEATVARLKSFDTVIVGVFNDSQASRASFERLSHLDGVIPVFFVNPFKMAKFKPAVTKAGTLLLAYDDTPLLREYGAQAVFGGIRVGGKLPVDLKGIADKGTGLIIAKSRLGFTSPKVAGLDPSLTRSVDSIARQAIKARAFPGCQVLIAKGGDVVLDGSWGNTDYTSGIPVTDETIYDLASVSKATGTLSGIMKAYDDGLIALDDSASRFIPGLRGTDKSDLTIRQLLYHETGMPPSLNMYTLMMDTATYSGPIMQKTRTDVYNIKIEDGLWGNAEARMRHDIESDTAAPGFSIKAAEGIYLRPAAYDTVMNAIYNARLAPTKKHVYSCLNFCLLMDLEQRVTGEPHDRYVADNIFRPLGAYTVGYRPRDYYPLDKIAPTERDSYLRRQTVHGYVHDELAAFSGGVQGNAGLFGNAGDLAKLCQMWLNGGTYGRDTLLSAETVRLFTSSPSKTCRRGLGFDMWNLTNGKTANGCPPDTYGHTGFTGTCFWVDPDNDIILIVLSNRVNPSRNNPANARLNPRAAIMRALYRALPAA